MEILLLRDLNAVSLAPGTNAKSAV